MATFQLFGDKCRLKNAQHLAFIQAFITALQQSGMTAQKISGTAHPAQPSLRRRGPLLHAGPRQRNRSPARGRRPAARPLLHPSAPTRPGMGRQRHGSPRRRRHGTLIESFTLVADAPTPYETFIRQWNGTVKLYQDMLDRKSGTTGISSSSGSDSGSGGTTDPDPYHDEDGGSNSEEQTNQQPTNNKQNEKASYSISDGLS